MLRCPYPVHGKVQLSSIEPGPLSLFDLQCLADIVFVNAHMFVSPANKSRELATAVECMQPLTVEVIFIHAANYRNRFFQTFSRFVTISERRSVIKPSLVSISLQILDLLWDSPI